MGSTPEEGVDHKTRKKDLTNDWSHESQTSRKLSAASRFWIFMQNQEDKISTRNKRRGLEDEKMVNLQKEKDGAEKS